MKPHLRMHPSEDLSLGWFSLFWRFANESVYICDVSTSLPSILCSLETKWLSKRQTGTGLEGLMNV